MEPLLTLLAVTALLLLIGALGVRGLRRLPAALRGGLSAMFLLTGVSHFAGMRAEMIGMVPDTLPAPELIVTLTGIAELAGAIGLLIPRLSLIAAAALTLLLVVMFPANVSYALSGAPLPWYDQLLWRTLMQAVYIAAGAVVTLERYHAWRASRRSQRAAAVGHADGARSDAVS